MWLTKEFLFPYWVTGSDFRYHSNGSGVLHGTYPNNPGGTNGSSLIPAQVTVLPLDEFEIQIDYEVVDLQYRDPMSGTRMIIYAVPDWLFRAR
jgi:hypothetical protein